MNLVLFVVNAFFLIQNDIRRRPQTMKFAKVVTRQGRSILLSNHMKLSGMDGRQASLAILRRLSTLSTEFPVIPNRPKFDG